MNRPIYQTKAKNASARGILAAAALAALIASFAAAAGTALAQPDELFAMYDRAMRSYELADHANAEAAFARVIKLSPDSTYGTQAAFYRGRSLIRLGRDKEALELWQSYYDRNMFIGSRAELFKLYEKFGLLEEKLAGFAARAAREPANMQHRHEYIELLIYMNRVDDAVAQYDGIIAARPGDLYIYKNAGDLLVRFKRYKEALRYYEKLLAMEPANENFLEAAGNACYQLGEVKKAREYWFRIIDSAREAHKFNTLANILQAHNMTDDAIEVYQACRKASGNPAAFFAELAELYEVKDDFKKLAGHYCGLIDSVPHLYTAVEQRLAETLKRNEEARAPLCAALDEELKKGGAAADPLKLRLAALAFLMAGRYEDALEANLKLAKITSNPVILEEYSRTLDALGMHALSDAALDRIAEAYRGSATEYNAMFMKAKFADARGRHADAIRLFNEVMANKNFSELYGDALYATAVAYFEGLDERARALEIFDTLEVNSANYRYESLYFKGAQALFERRFDYAEAMLKQVAGLGDHRRSAAASALMAYSLVYQGSYEAAIDGFRETLARYPSYEGAAGIFEDMKAIRAAQSDAKEDLAAYFEASREFLAAHYRTAEAALETLARRDGPLAPDAARLLYRTKFKLGKYDEFKKCAESFIERAGDDQSRAEAVYELAARAFERGGAETAAASTRLETILKKYPGALLSNKSKKMLSMIKGDKDATVKKKDSFFGYN